MFQQPSISTSSQPILNDDDPLLAKWQRINISNGPSPKPRHGHKAVAIKELLIVYGGGNEGIFDDLYVYNTTTGLWYKPTIRNDTEKPPGLAAFGMCCDGEKIYIFGGMINPDNYSNDLYELDTRRWEYKQLRPRAPRAGGNGPVARFGHSFSIDSEGYGYVFGGCGKDAQNGQVIYLNDFYRVKLDSSTTAGVLAWENLLPKDGSGPSVRESHSAVINETNGQKQLILYGGMNGDQRLSDIWICDLRTFVWQQIEQGGIAPLGRSLHSASLVNGKMYIFGGWVTAQGEEVTSSPSEPPKAQWKCSNDLCCFNLKTRKWEMFAESLCNNGEQMPKARAGHCSALVHNRIYVWSGREGVRKMMNAQICCNDMFFLETSAPTAPEHLQLVRATMNGVEIQWANVPTANEYALQIFKVPNVENEQPANPPLPNILQSRGGRAIRPANAAVPPAAQQGNQNGQVTRYYLTPQNNAVVRMVAPSTATPPPSAQTSGAGTPSGSSTPQPIPQQVPQPGSSYSFASSSTATLPPQMPNNILDESFASESMDTSTSKAIDPSTISLLSDVGTESNTTSASTVQGNQLDDTKPLDETKPLDDTLQGDEAEPKDEKDVVEGQTGDVPADPQSATGQVEKASTGEEKPAANGNEKAGQGPSVQVQQQDETWHDVGTIKGATSHLVTHYFLDQNPNEAERRKTALEPGTQYKFRVAAINSCGQSNWSPEASFRTCIPGYPGAPSSIKITKGQDCARLQWAAPSTPNGTICEYSVYLAMRTADAGSPFLRVYAGAEPSCTVSNKTLQSALIDSTPKPAVIFRIAARNEKGYGPATQVRWLQDNRLPLPPRPSPMQAIHSQHQGSSGPFNKRIRLD